MSNSRNNTHRQSWLTFARIVALVLLMAIVAITSIQLSRPAPKVPSAAEIAEAVNGPAEFQRPSAMEYVAKTNSCVVGGTVISASWHVGLDEFPIGEVVDANSVDYTSFVFESDTGRQFTVSENGALFSYPGQNLGLELQCDPATMSSDDSFGMIAIIYGGL